MNKRLIFSVILLALVASVTSMTLAEPGRRARADAADILPPHEIVTIVRSLGLGPIGEPSRRGYHYVLHAFDPQGTRVRIVADAQFGDILAMSRVQPVAVTPAPRYSSGPRIIHVPQDGDFDGVSGANARVDRRGKSFVRDVPVRRKNPVREIPMRGRGFMREEPPLPPGQDDLPPYANDDRDVPENYERSDRAAVSRREFEPPPAPPPPRRAILSAPPPEEDRPNWIKPTPRWTKEGKFDQQPLPQLPPASPVELPVDPATWARKTEVPVPATDAPQAVAAPAAAPENPAAPPPPPLQPSQLIQFPPIAPLN